MRIVFYTIIGFALVFFVLQAIGLISNLPPSANSFPFAQLIDSFLLIVLSTLVFLASIAAGGFVVIYIYKGVRNFIDFLCARGVEKSDMLIGLLFAGFFVGGALPLTAQFLFALADQILVQTPVNYISLLVAAQQCLDENAIQAGGFICTTKSLNNLTNGLGHLLGSLFGPWLNNGSNLMQLIWFSAAFLVATITWKHIRTKCDTREQFWCAYAAICCVAVYLSLTATLAISLMESDKEGASQDVPVIGALLENIRARGEVKPLEFNGLVLSGSSDEIPQSVTNELMQIHLDLAALHKRSEDFRTSIQNKLVVRQAAAVSNFQIEMENTDGVRETQIHQKELISWHTRQVDLVNAAILNCRRVTETAKEIHRQRAHQLLQSAGGQKSGFLELRRALPPLDGATRFGGDCNPQNVAFEPMPERQPFGASLGIIGDSVSWLVAIESVEASMLVGLIGFGLLGALLSQFLTKTKLGREDLFGAAVVVFAGFSAAIVVFLASFGGLPILTTTQNEVEPNPFVVFAACLVAGVYSGEIWKRAKARMFGQTPPNPADGGE